MTDQRKGLLRRKLQWSRRRIHNLDPDFAEPLYDMLFVATENVTRISTNGKCIYFDPDWLGRLGERELDFIISHQLMHVFLGHIDRSIFYSGDRFHLACDIIANSNLSLMGWMYGTLPKIGRIYTQTFYPVYEGSVLTCEEALSCVPFDPATLDAGKKRRYMIDSDEWWDQKRDRGECGIVVLSPLDNDPDYMDDSIPDIGGEGDYIPFRELKKTNEDDAEEDRALSPDSPPVNVWDIESEEELESLRNIASVGKKADFKDGFVERVWCGIGTAQLNWRQLLNFFIQEEVYDYSFTPPDKRIQDSNFFLPDYNEKNQIAKRILFAVDTSESIEDDDIVKVYAEMCNALMQFNGGLEGWVGFFDTNMYTPTKIANISDLAEIRPKGGGGTDFSSVFDYIRDNMSDELPASIVIFTDGMGEIPDESVALNIPVLWLFSGKSASAPWGNVAYVR